MTSTMTETRPRIYVACLAAYNSGYLHGAWIDATQDEWAIWDGIQAMLATSPMPDAEEHAIHDYEGFGDIRLSEYTSVETVVRLAAFMAEHGALGVAVLAQFCGDIDEATEALRNQYLGCYASLADYVQELTEATATIPESLRYYIDWQAMARDVEISGDLFTVETAHDEIHVFAGR